MKRPIILLALLALSGCATTASLLDSTGSIFSGLGGRAFSREYCPNPMLPRSARIRVQAMRPVRSPRPAQTRIQQAIPVRSPRIRLQTVAPVETPRRRPVQTASCRNEALRALERARKSYQEFAYGEALSHTTRTLACKELDARSRWEVLILRGASFYLLNQSAEARRCFGEAKHLRGVPARLDPRFYPRAIRSFYDAL